MRQRHTRTVAGRYVLLDQIGRGGTGTVWTAWDRRERRLVAAKVLAAHGDPTVLLRFVLEQGVRINDPHVLAPTGWAAEDDVVLLLTELVRGGSLRDLLEEHPRPAEAFGALLLAQLLQALIAVHRHGVVHGDVKPANLLLHATGGDRPHLVLADFGVATRAGDTVRFEADGPVGTPGFLAPEQKAGAPPHPSQDVYAAGVVGRHLVTGSSAVVTLLDSMTRADAARRPSAEAALHRLRSLPVSRGGPWPVIADRLSGQARRVGAPS